MVADKPKLPLAHPTPITWIAVATVLVIIALYVIWALFFAEPAYPLLQ